MALNLWDFHEVGIQQIVDGIRNLPDIAYVEVKTPLGRNYHSGQRTTKNFSTKSYDIVFQQQVIGTLFVEANYQEIYQKLLNKAWVILLTQFIKTFIVAFFIVAIIYWFVARHIYKIAEYSSQLSLSNLRDQLDLGSDRVAPDELDMLADSINNARKQLLHEVELRTKAEVELAELNRRLEQQVIERTQELSESLEHLKEAQNELVQAEKMAALGQLVAGIAHEINTPLGVGVTAGSIITSALEEIQSAFETNQLSKSQLNNFLSSLKDTTELLNRNLLRAGDLIKNFKSVAVNQSSDSMIKSNMLILVNEIVATVKTMFRRKNYTINVDIEQDFTLVTYPSAWIQIVTNLLMNSHLHAFENQMNGTIEIAMRKIDDEQYTFIYQDNGCGIPDEIIETVFDPFITTKRGRGGSGLGLNILFNLVNNLLQGKVTVKNKCSGCQFTIVGPVVIETERMVQTVDEKA